MRFEEANLGRFKLFETVLCIIAEHEAPTDVAIAIDDDFAMLDSPKAFDFPDKATRLQLPCAFASFIICEDSQVKFGHDHVQINMPSSSSRRSACAVHTHPSRDSPDSASPNQTSPRPIAR